ncbi:MAG: nucleotidyl transferase AbiEii/AbiGii toxin family protein [Sphingobacteriales bacterium]|nr:nucleotidyl transferase AbiEii/AbiGii toxin family protein [Sphingobacteriales bacterium]
MANIDYLHRHKEFPELIRIIAEEQSIDPGLVEKDYWIMHILFGLQRQGFTYQLKGGTSLSKGFKIINRFSEDIDIFIKPPAEFNINENPNNNKSRNIVAKKSFYDWLAENIHIDGIIKTERDIAFDNEQTYNSGGIRLFYETYFDIVDGIKEGVLLEAGFDNVTPNTPITISSWAYDSALNNAVSILDNRAIDLHCYHPGYTLVEKLQTVATKFRKEQESGDEGVNFMRQYYDIASLLAHPEVQEFIGSDEYLAHKKKRFPTSDLQVPLKENPAFLLEDEKIRSSFKNRYHKTRTLYYKGQPDLDEILSNIKIYLEQL